MKINRAVLHVLCALGLSSLAAEPARKIEWPQGGFLRAQAQALQEGKLVGALFTDAGCGHCVRFKREVQADPATVELLADLCLVQLDIASDEGAPLAQQHRAYKSPTLLLLDPRTEEEIDRIAGYKGAEAFRARLTDYIAGTNTFADMRAQAAADPTRPDLFYALARKYVDRSLMAQALQSFDRVAALDPGNQAGFTDDALYDKGRYLQEKAKKPKLAVSPLTRVVREYPRSDKAIFSFYRLVRTYVDLDDGRAIAAAYQSYVPAFHEDARPHRTVANELCSHWSDDVELMAVALAAARKAVEIDPSGWSYYVLAESLSATGASDAARIAVDKAISLEPGKARYEALRQRLLK